MVRLNETPTTALAKQVVERAILDLFEQPIIMPEKSFREKGYRLDIYAEKDWAGENPTEDQRQHYTIAAEIGGLTSRSKIFHLLNDFGMVLWFPYRKDEYYLLDYYSWLKVYGYFVFAVDLESEGYASGLEKTIFSKGFSSNLYAFTRFKPDLEEGVVHVLPKFEFSTDDCPIVFNKQLYGKGSV